MATTEDRLAEDRTVAIARSVFRRRRWRGRLRRWRGALVALVAVLVLASAAWVVFFSSALAVQKVAVEGVTTITGQRVRQAAQAPFGTPLARVDLAAIQARVEAIPSVRVAEVSRGWPHTIKVSVTERTPLAVVSRGTGLQALDSEGVLFGHFARPPAGLPLVKTPPDVGADALLEASRVVSSLRSDILAKVDQVEVATVDEIRLRLRDGRVVVWGSADSSSEKAQVLAVLLNRAAHEIDVSVPSRPTTR